MSQDAESHLRRRPGRPRSSQARDAILDAAYRILTEEGLGRLTVEAVAQRAGVGKPTIYRSWANAQELAMAALLSRPQAAPAPAASRSGKADLKAQMRDVIAAFATPRGRQITLMMASSDGESELSKAFRNQVILRCREAGRAILQQAEAGGEAVVGEHMESVLDILYGPIFYRLLAGHLPLSPAFGDAVVDTVFHGIAVRPEN